MASGLNNHVGIGKEESYGTAVEPTVFIPIKESDGVQINKDIQFNEAIKSGVPGKNKGSFVGKVEYAGGYESELYPQFIGHLLRSAFGDVDSELAYGESDVYEHTFTESLTKLSYTIEQKIGEIIKRFAGFVVKNVKIEGKVGEALSFAFEGIGQSQATNAGATPTYETPRAFNFVDITSVKIGSTDIKAQCEEFSFEYDNGVEGFYAMGDNELKAVYPKPSESKGKLTLYLDDTTKAFLEDYIAKTERAIEIIAEGEDIGDASHNKVRIYLPKAALTSSSSKLGTDYNVMEVEFEGVVDATNGLVQIVLTNEVSSYD